MFPYRAMNRLLPSILLIVAAVIPSVGQVNTRIASVDPSEAPGKTPLTLTATLQQVEGVDHVLLFYRPFGETEYRQADMDLTGNTASATLPAGVVLPPFLEYYVVLALHDGSLETYPLGESANPLAASPERTMRVTVVDEEAEDMQVVSLSPDRFGVLDPADVVVSISLLRADTTVARRATEILLDGADVTVGCVFSDDLIILVPENLSFVLAPGQHRVTVRLFDRDGTLAHVASLPFTVTGESGGVFMPRHERDFSYGVNLDAESRREEVQQTGTWYNRVRIKAEAKTGEWKAESNVFVTSDEKSNRQPQNRYFAGVSSSWLHAGYGDSYPSFPDIILSGKRVRGVNAGLDLGDFRIDLTAGSTVRAVEGTLVNTFSADSFAVQYARDPGAPYGRIDSATWGKFAYGTYARKIFAIRPSFGSGKIWQFGLTFLHGIDETTSILYGIRPQENAVLGADFKLRLDDGRIAFNSQGGFSAYNSDISSGSFTDAYIDTVYKNDAETVKRARDVLQHVITVNDNLRPLSLKKFSTLAYDASLALQYFDNSLKGGYVFRGSDYATFGQSYLRKDIQGFNLLDRIRLLSNQTILTVGYEQLHDNTDNAKAATTVTRNVNAAFSYYGAGTFPRVTVGYARLANNNGLSSTGGDSLSMVDDMTNRYYLQSSYDFVAGASHTAKLSISTSDLADHSPRRFDVKNLTVAFGLSSKFTVPLETSADVAINTNDLPTGTTAGGRRRLDYTTVDFNCTYAFLADALSVNAGYSPTFGDFRRTVSNMSVTWAFRQGMKVLLQFTNYGNVGTPDDNFVSLRYQCDI